MLLGKNDQFQTDDFATYTAAQLKGRRLRMARALTGYSRHDLCEKIGIATSTMDTWECGRVELTEKSAMRVCTALLNVSLNCSVEWLLTGNGEPPRLMDEIEKSVLLPNRNITTAGDSSPVRVKTFNPKIPFCSDEAMGKELSFFLGIHKDAIFHIVDHEAFNFRYKIGDCVAGPQEKLSNLVGKIIIGVLKNEKTILCRLVSCSKTQQSEDSGEEQDCVIFLNSNNTQKKVQLIAGAEIIWHRSMKSLTF